MICTTGEYTDLLLWLPINKFNFLQFSFQVATKVQSLAVIAEFSLTFLHTTYQTQIPKEFGK